MASQAEATSEIGRTSSRPKIFCPRTGPEGRSNFDPHFLCAQSKDLDETITKTPFSDRNSNIFILDLSHEVGDEQDPEAVNRSKRFTFLCKSLSIDDPKPVKITPEKGNITATIIEPQVHHDLSAHNDQYIEHVTKTQRSIDETFTFMNIIADYVFKPSHIVQEVEAAQQGLQMALNFRKICYAGRTAVTALNPHVAHCGRLTSFLINKRAELANAQLRIINSQLRGHNTDLQINAAIVIQKNARSIGA